MVEVAVALGLEAGQELGGHGAEGNDHPGLAGRLGDDAHVLVVERDPEAGGEVAGQHGRGLAVQDGAAGQAAGQDLDGRAGVDPGRLQEHDRLGHQLQGAGDDQLVGRLDGLAGPGRPDVDDRPADRLQHRPSVGDVGRLAADHDRQRALDRALLAAAHRGVKDAQAPLPAGRGQPPGHVGPDGAHVDVQGARPGGGVDPVLAEGERLDVGRVGDHGDDHVGVADGLGQAGCPAAAVGLEPPDLLGRAVVADDGEAGPDQVDGHGAAHDAEADDGDRGHRAAPAPRVASQPKLSALAPLGWYSRPTQPA